MKKIIIAALIVSPFLFSCGGNEEKHKKTEDSLTSVTTDLEGKVSDKEKAINDMLGQFNEIQENLNVIKEKEKIATVASKNPEMAKSQKDQIIEDIQSIYELMNRNKGALASMNKKMKNANIKMDQMQKMIDNLNAMLADKETEITSLKEELEKVNTELASLKLDFKEVTEESEAKTDKLNTAFYAFGTSKELIKQGVLTKEGGFIGMGKSEKLKADFNKKYFTQVDVSKTMEIPLACKKAKLVTTHPGGSYKFEGEQGKKIEKLVISNADDFWSASKYLVIVIE